MERVVSSGTPPAPPRVNSTTFARHRPPKTPRGPPSTNTTPNRPPTPSFIRPSSFVHLTGPGRQFRDVALSPGTRLTPWSGGGARTAHWSTSSPRLSRVRTRPDPVLPVRHGAKHLRNPMPRRSVLPFQVALGHLPFKVAFGHLPFRPFSLPRPLYRYLPHPLAPGSQTWPPTKSHP